MLLVVCYDLRYLFHGAWYWELLCCARAPCSVLDRIVSAADQWYTRADIGKVECQLKGKETWQRGSAAGEREKERRGRERASVRKKKLSI